MLDGAGGVVGAKDDLASIVREALMVAREMCAHPNPVAVESYYSDTQWCPDCGAVRGHNGLFGGKSEFLPWQTRK